MKLHVSTKTVDANRRKVMDKLDANTIADLVKIAISENLVDFDFNGVSQRHAMAL